MSPIPGRGHALHKPHRRGECPRLPPKGAQTAWQVVFIWSAALLNPQQAHGSFRPARGIEKRGISSLLDRSLAGRAMRVIVREKLTEIGHLSRIEREQPDRHRIDQPEELAQGLDA